MGVHLLRLFGGRFGEWRTSKGSRSRGRFKAAQAILLRWNDKFIQVSPSGLTKERKIFNEIFGESSNLSNKFVFEVEMNFQSFTQKSKTLLLRLPLGTVCVLSLLKRWQNNLLFEYSQLQQNVFNRAKNNSFI